MRIFEKILLGLLVLIIIFRMIPYYFEQDMVFGLGVLVIVPIYMIGGYWILRPPGGKQDILPIVSGIAFGLSIFTFLRLMNAYHQEFTFWFPMFNGVLFLVLIVLLIVNRRKPGGNKYYRNLLIRSSVLLAVTAFLAYAPAEWKIYRLTIKAVNAYNPQLISNMEMFDHRMKYKQALELGHCEEALEYALKSNEAGLNWLGVDLKQQQQQQELKSTLEALSDNGGEAQAYLKDMMEQLSYNSELQKISGTYSALYESHNCLGDNFFNKKNYSNALTNFEKAYEALTIVDHQSQYYEEQEPWVLKKMAECQSYLENYQTSDSLFFAAIQKQILLTDTTNPDLGYIFGSFAESMGRQQYFGYSNKFHLGAINLLSQDSLDDDKQDDINSNFQYLIQNHLKTDSLHKALVYTRAALEVIPDTARRYCLIKLLQGTCEYKLSRFTAADSTLKGVLKCIDQHDNIGESVTMMTLLALGITNHAMAEYDAAYKYLNDGLTLAREINPDPVSTLPFLQTLAALDLDLGKYEESQKRYQTVLAIYHKAGLQNDNRLVGVLSHYSQLQLVLSNFQPAKSYSDSALNQASRLMGNWDPTSTIILNNSAYVEYSLGNSDRADFLFSKASKVNQMADMSRTVNYAVAINGLGLVHTEKRDYAHADESFSHALSVYRKIYQVEHPAIATVYLNYARLKTETGKLQEAAEMLESCSSIYRDYFPSDHDHFADLQMALGDLAKKSLQKEKAREHYQNARDIYSAKFGNKNFKTIAANNRLLQML